MIHEAVTNELKAAAQACKDVEKAYKDRMEKYFPVGCVVRWSQTYNCNEYHCTGEVQGTGRAGCLIVRNLKTGKRRDNIDVFYNKVIRLDGSVCG